MATDKPKAPLDENGKAVSPKAAKAASTSGRGEKSLDSSSAAPATQVLQPSGGSKSLPTGGNSSVPGGGTAGAASTLASVKDAEGVDKLDAVGKNMDGQAANIAGAAAQQAVQGKSDSKARQNVGRYTGVATSGAVAGAQQGGLHGAALGAARNVAVEGAKDLAKGVSSITGGSPDAKPADMRLGAGGTSYEREGKDDSEGLGSKVAKGAAIGGAASAAPPAAALIVLMAFLNWLKTMFFAAIAMLMNMGNLIWAFLVNLVKAVGHAVAAPFIAVGNAISGLASFAFGVAAPATIAPAAAIASGAAAVLTIGSLIGGLLTGGLNTSALLDDHPSSGVCTVDTKRGGSGDVEVPSGSDKNAQVVYSVLHSWNMPDENIAGILGNWSAESGIDPTSVQGFYRDKYTLTPEKASAAKNTDNGIGLGQWTFGRNTALRDYAKSKGKDWWTIEPQLAFMADGDTAGKKPFEVLLTESQGSPGAAAQYFHDKWEISADGPEGVANRRAQAEAWFAKMSSWTADDSAASGVEDIVGSLINGVSDGVRAVFGLCNEDHKGGIGNVSLAEGGMTEEQAEALIALYNKEGDKFLDARYGDDGGPGSCGSNHAMNCVSFSTYFVNKYTTFQTYPMGNGIQTAYTIASETGKTMTDVPMPYSVGSGPGSGSAGHTLVVLGVDGTKVIVGEAGYCSFMGRVRVTTVEALQSAGWKFVDMSDEMLPESDVKTT